MSKKCAFTKKHQEKGFCKKVNNHKTAVMFYLSTVIKKEKKSDRYLEGGRWGAIEMYMITLLNQEF